GARESLVVARKAAENIKNDEYKSRAFRDIAKAQAETGDIAGARESLVVARKAAENIKNDDYKSWAFRDTARAQAETGDITGAKATAAQITDDDDKDWAFRDIAYTQAKTGDITGARDTAANITNGSYKSRAYMSITEKQNMASAGKTATGITNKDFVKTLPMPGSEIKSWTDFALTYQLNPPLADLQGFLKSLKGAESSREVVVDLINNGIQSMLDPLKELQDNEVKWSEIRAQSTP
ncbi:MAG: hypothetical protein J3T61_02885, partial [Candidatus Brocadiales bacterium]|nr:hypothetical protein [Candidatus Bathyanammoxibius sp.]